MEVLAIVVARSGSKGIPDKNIKALGHHALMGYSIAAGLQCSQVTRTILSTDDEHYADIGKFYGAEVPFIRPGKYAEDDTPDLPVFQHTLKWLWEHEKYEPSLVVHLRPTTPFRHPFWISNAIDIMRQTSLREPHSVRGVIPSPEPPFKQWWGDGGEIKPITIATPFTIWREPWNAPRQELPPTYHHTGQIDVVRPKYTIDVESMTGKVVVPLHLVPKYHVDLDDELDWERAEWMLKHLGSQIVTP